MKFLQKKWFQIAGNKYVLITLFFLIWMFFFDTNSYLIHNELNNDIEKLESDKKYFQQEIKENTSQIKKLNSQEGIEAFARGTYYMKRPNEDIYIIESQDSTQLSHD